MEKSFRSLLSLSSQSFAYGVGFYGRQIVIYLTLPLLTTILTQEEFGVISVLTSFYTVINTLTNVGLPSATFRLYNDQDDIINKQLILGSAQVIFFAVAVLAAMVMIIFAPLISSSLIGSTVYASSIRVISILLIFETLNYFGNIMLRLNVRPGAVSLHSVIFIFAQMGTALVLIKYYKFGVIGYWMGYLFGGVIALLLMIWLNRDEIVFKVSKKHSRELLQYAIPLIPATFSINFLQLTDRYFIRSFVGLESVAVYAIGYKVGSFTNLILAPFRIAWPNFAFSSLKNSNAKKIYRDVLTYMLMASMFFVLIVSVFRTDLIQLLSPDSYLDATKIVPWIAFSMVFLGLYPIFSLGPRVKKKTVPLAWLALGTSILNIILNLILVDVFGSIGAAAAALISYLILAVVSLLVGRKFYSFPVDTIRLLKIFIATGVVFYINEDVIQYFGLWSKLLITKIGVLILYPTLLLAMKFMPIKDIKTIFLELKKIVEIKISQKQV